MFQRNWAKNGLFGQYLQQPGLCLALPIFVISRHIFRRMVHYASESARIPASCKRGISTNGKKKKQGQNYLGGDMSLSFSEAGSPPMPQ